MRDPFTAEHVNVAGRPSRLGGTVAGALGWMVLGVGLLSALLVALFFQALFPAGYLGIALGLMIGIGSVVAGALLLAGSRRLHSNGASAQLRAQERTLFALAAHLGGTVTPLDAARSLGIAPQEADRLLTDLAKRGDQVRLEIDDDGNLFYLFPEIAGPTPRKRVAAPGPAAEPEAREAEIEVDREAEEADEELPGRARRPRAPRRWL